MSKRFVTIVSDEKGGFSFHTSWKTACETYGWETTPRVPTSKGQYSIKKAPFDVRIECLELIEFISRKDISQSCFKGDEGWYEFEVNGYDTTYTITTDFETKHEEEDMHYGDRGSEEITPAYDYDVPTSIVQVTIHDEEGTEVKTDSWTNQQLLNFLNIKD